MLVLTVFPRLPEQIEGHLPAVMAKKSSLTSWELDAPESTRLEKQLCTIKDISHL